MQNFFLKKLARIKIIAYLCIVFFIVLDLRLTKVWVTAVTLFCVHTFPRFEGIKVGIMHSFPKKLAIFIKTSYICNQTSKAITLWRTQVKIKLQ